MRLDMTTNSKKSAKGAEAVRPKNVFRIVTPTSSGWQVRITRAGEQHTKFFSDRRYGDSKEALVHAVSWRDGIRDQLPESQQHLGWGRNPRSGVDGIRLVSLSHDRKRKRPKSVGYVQAAADRAGVVERKSYSIEKWGLRRALWQACIWLAKHEGCTRDEAQAWFDTAYANLRRYDEVTRL